MRTFVVVVDVPIKKRDWCLYDNEEMWINIPTTTLILSARDMKHLMSNITKQYENVRILKIKEIKEIS